MLFYLTDSLIVNKDDDRYNDIFKCVRNLTIAADECQHELMGDIHVLEHWKGLFANDPCRAVLLNLINNFSTTSVPSYITEYVEIVLENPQNRSYWKNRSRLGQCAGAEWDTFDAAKLMIFSETVAF